MEYTDILTPIITLVTAQITVLDLAKFRFPRKKLLLILGILLIVQIAVNAPLLIYGGLGLYTRFYFLTMDIPGFLTFYYISKRRDFRDVFTVLITLFISFADAMIALWIAKIMGFGHIGYNMIRIVIFTGSILFLHFIIRKHYMQLQEEIDKGWGFFSILPIIATAFVYYKFWQYSINGNFYEKLVDCTITVMILIVVFIVFYYIFLQLHEKNIVQEQKRILSLQNKAQLEQFEQQKEAAEKSNRRWHDMRHHTMQMIELLESGNTEEALAYLKEQAGMVYLSKEQYCLHPAVNSILSLWADRSKLAGIRVDIRTDIPDKLEIEPTELSALFANAFENAYEGCHRVDSDIQKYITVEAKYNGRRLAIGFTNCCDKEVNFSDGLPVSSKSGGGIGTRSILYTVKRFHGTAYFDAADGVFTARFILNVSCL